MGSQMSSVLGTWAAFGASTDILYSPAHPAIIYSPRLQEGPSRSRHVVTGTYNVSVEM